MENVFCIVIGILVIFEFFNFASTHAAFTLFVLCFSIFCFIVLFAYAKSESKRKKQIKSEKLAEEKRLLEKKQTKKQQVHEEQNKLKTEQQQDLKVKLNSSQFMGLAEKFVAQYIEEDKYKPIKIFSPDEIKIFAVIVQDELKYSIDTKTLSEYLITLSAKMNFAIFDKKFTKDNPNIGNDLKGWVGAYIDTFESNLDFVELLSVKIEDLNIDCSKEITNEEIQKTYYSIHGAREIDDLDARLINGICQQLVENWRVYYLMAHINREIEQRHLTKQANQHKENMAGGGKIRKNQIEINNIDTMDGISFEKFLVNLFANMNYKAEITQASNDQGADLIIEKLGERTAVQAKCYSNTVGNTAVQEVTGAKQYYNCIKAMVITNNYFTKSAIELAYANNVELKDREDLISLLANYPVYAEDIFATGV